MSIFANPVTVVLIALLLVLCYFAFVRPYQYFQKRHIIGPKPVIIFGNFLEQLFKGFRETQLEYEQKYGPIYGMFTGYRKEIVVSDPELLKLIYAKNFNVFPNRGLITTGHYTQKGLFTVKDDHWKHNRNILTPTFSSAKLKQMQALIMSAVDMLMQKFYAASETSTALEMKSHFGAFTMDVIASTAFGLQLDAQTNPSDEFVKNGRAAVTFTLTDLRVLAGLLFPWLIRVLNKIGYKMPFFKDRPSAFFANIVRHAIEQRESSGMQTRKDLLKQMLDVYVDDETMRADIRNGHPDVAKDEFGYWTKRGLTSDEMMANGILFFVAGYETTSAALTFLSYMLATNPDVQARLHDEIDQILPDGAEPNYANVKQLEYLDACIHETLRLFPPIVRIDRYCNEDIDLKGKVLVEKGMYVGIPVLAIHMSEKYYDEPERFWPQRFLGEAGQQLLKNSYTYMPFGLGPRICIGQRLAMYEMKLVISRVMQRYSFDVAPETQIPLKLDKGFLPNPERGVWLKINQRQSSR